MPGAMLDWVANASRTLEDATALAVTPDGWLDGPGVTRVPSVRQFPLTSRGADDKPAPLGICWHWTDGVCRPGYAALLAQRIREFHPGDRAASWHVVIAKQGQIYQSVPLTAGAWHVAKGTVADDHGQCHRVNRCLVGIELENTGRVKRIGGAWRGWPYWRQDAKGAWVLDAQGQRIPDPRLAIADERVRIVPRVGAFDEFPDAQVVAARRVASAILTRFALRPARCRYLHADFDDNREDAGPVWRAVHLPTVVAG